MRRVENAFVRWFNRRFGRDGSLFRGRFTSRVIENDFYRWNVRRYIDLNPVHAGLVSEAKDYPHGSARWNHLGHGPSWLTLRPRFSDDYESPVVDEPLGLMRDLAHDGGLAVVAVLHDLTLAGGHCDRVVLLGEGRTVAVGPPSEVLSVAAIERVFRVAVRVERHPTTGAPFILPDMRPRRGDPSRPA
jgi:hypothetical protein